MPELSHAAFEPPKWIVLYLSHVSHGVDLLPSGLGLDMHQLPYETERSLRYDLHELSHHVQLVVPPSGLGFDVYQLPRPALWPLELDMHELSLGGLLVGVPSPELELVYRLSPRAVEPLR